MDGHQVRRRLRDGCLWIRSLNRTPYVGSPLPVVSFLTSLLQP